MTEYGRLHDANCKLFGDAYDAFLADIFLERSRWTILLDQFRAEVDEAIWHALFMAETKVHEAKVSWFRMTADTLYITLDIGEDEGFDRIARDNLVHRATADALRKVYRYEGPFEFEPNDPPF